MRLSAALMFCLIGMFLIMQQLVHAILEGECQPIPHTKRVPCENKIAACAAEHGRDLKW
jgi:hypothetical protein